MQRRVAFVTGAASGLGAAIATRLAHDGIEIVIADIDEDGGRRLADKLEGASSLRCDVSDLDSVREAATEAVERHGQIDALVNNAGFDEPGFFLDTDPDMWRRLLAVNLTGVLNCTHAIAPLMAERARATGYGRIVTIASDAGRVGSMGEAVYSAAKGGVIAFSKSMARELARDKVTVNAICPGPADTPMTEAIRTTELGDKFLSGMVRVTPLRRLVDPDEVAAAASYFLSDDARFTTGQVLSVSGGLTMSG